MKNKIKVGLLLCVFTGSVLGLLGLLPQAKAQSVGTSTNSYLVDTGGINRATVWPYAELSTSSEPSNRFQDTFDSGVRDANNWATPTTAGGASACTWAAGNVACGTGTTANGYAYMTTNPTFRPTQPGYIRSGFAIKLPAQASLPSNSYAFWGTATPTATPTAASPVQEGCGFELQPGVLGAGKMYVACYAGAARTVIADMSASTGNGMQPTDGLTHRYAMDFAGDSMVFYLGSYTSGAKDQIVWNVIATQQNGVNGPNVNTQPVLLMTVAGASAPSSSLALNIAATWVGQTNNNNWMCDATYSYRCATVDAAGNLHSALSDDSAISGSVTSATTLFSVDMLNYNSATVQLTGNASGNTITFETSDNNSNWVVTSGLDTAADAGYGAPQTSTASTSGIMLQFPKRGRYFRARVSNFIGGTTSVVGNLHQWQRSFTNSVSFLSNSGVNIGAVSSAPYGANQTFVSASSGNVANGSAAASLAAVSAKTNFLTGLDITSDGATTGLCVNPTITGVLGGTRTMTYCAPAGVLLEATPLVMSFNPPLQASGVNTAITVTLPALGSGSAQATVNAQGYVQ